MFLLGIYFSQAQTTIGLLHYDASVSDGYTLFGINKIMMFI